MHYEKMKEILDSLPKDLTIFPYCRDNYAARLLLLAARHEDRISALKRSPFARLMQKPGIAPLIANCGNGRLDVEALQGHWCEPGTVFVLTVGEWGGPGGSFEYSQTSRDGCNLVLRLHLGHAEQKRHFGLPTEAERDRMYFDDIHPILEPHERPYFRTTLAWARLDIEPVHGEVLIEEIQMHEIPNGYCASVDWSQAMLMATIEFIQQELNISNIWYHTWETGAALKHIPTGPCKEGFCWDHHLCRQSGHCEAQEASGPPRSTYTTLPRQFCFQETDEIPEMLRDASMVEYLQDRDKPVRFFKLEL